ncbi:threonyl-tRNA synthetase editing domain-containing protein [archaeon]
MRGVILGCRKFKYTDTRKSTWPKGIFPTAFGSGEFRDAIVVLSCIEKGDNMEYIESAVQRVVELNNAFHRKKKVVILPFAHLSNKLEHPRKALPLLVHFQERLQEEGFSVGSASFGTDKDALFDILGHRASVSYFEFPYNGKQEVE